MKKLAVFVWLITCAVGGRSLGQIAAAPAGSPAPVKKAEKPAKAKDKQKEDKSSAANLFGSSPAGIQSDQPTTTEIYSDEAFFDSTKNMGIFSGRVKVVDPRFNLQSDKLQCSLQRDKTRAWRKPSQKGTLDLCATGPIRMAALPLALLAAPIKPPIQLTPAMLNWWEHRGCKRDKTCMWQPALIRS